VNHSSLSLLPIALLGIMSAGLSIAPRASNAAAIITIDDSVEGILPPPTIVDQPPGVPGIQNVVAGNDMMSFTYDDLVPAATTRTRLEFFFEQGVTPPSPGMSVLSDEFSWSVTAGSSVETIVLISDPNPITFPTPCIFNLDFFENSCLVVGEFNFNDFTVETTGTTYVILNDLFPEAEVPEPGSLAMLGAALAGFGLVRRRSNSRSSLRA
jgi:PEP-CTERM motif-containing protein